MSKSFFDLNSNDTFNQLENYLFNFSKYNPIDKELYWVTKTFHSIGQNYDNYWRSIIRMGESSYYIPFDKSIRLYLNCGHWTDLNQSSYNNYQYLNKIRINCIPCGGTGKIKVDE